MPKSFTWCRDRAIRKIERLKQAVKEKLLKLEESSETDNALLTNIEFNLKCYKDEVDKIVTLEENE